MKTRPRAILIAGPTASGKSSAALELAKNLDGTIINADSMQVYKELRILSARPSLQEEAVVPHHLYGTVPASQAYSTGMWVDDVADTLQRVWQDGRMPIIVGGTGLYFYALENGLSQVPEIPDAIRQKWRDRLVRDGVGEVYETLRLLDKKMAARLEPTDSQRIVRAVEVIEATGRSLLEWHELTPANPVLAGEDILRLVVAPERQEIYRRCDLRFDTMMEQGALVEVQELLALELDFQLPAMKALGVPQLASYLLGELTKDQAVERAKTDTRRYAKRQITWLKRNMISWNSINEKHSKKIYSKILSFI